MIWREQSTWTENVQTAEVNPSAPEVRVLGSRSFGRLANAVFSVRRTDRQISYRSSEGGDDGCKERFGGGTGGELRPLRPPSMRLANLRNGIGLR